MAVADWPSGLPEPSVDFQEAWDMPTVSSPTEMGMPRQRPEFTYTPIRYSIVFPFLTEDEKTDITDHFDGIGWGGGITRWTHPGSGAATVYTRLQGSVNFRALGNYKYSCFFVWEKVPDEAAL